jgi:hypothetical protein
VHTGKKRNGRILHERADGDNGHVPIEKTFCDQPDATALCQKFRYFWKEPISTRLPSGSAT